MEFEYIARNQKGTIEKGRLEGRNEKEVVDLILAYNYYPILVKRRYKFMVNIKKILSYEKIKYSEKLYFTRQMGILLNAGVGIVKALDLIADGLKNKRFRKIIENIKEDLQKGLSLSKSMEKYPSVFSEFYGNMIKLGEKTGRLSNIFGELYKYDKKVQDLNSKIKKASLYPMILALVSLFVSLFLLVYILPNFISIYEGNEELLPGQTKLLLSFSTYLIENKSVIFIRLVLTFILIIAFFTTTYGNRLKDLIKIKLPFFKKIYMTNMINKFLKNLSILTTSGTPILTALYITIGTIENEILRDKFNEIYDYLKIGNSLSFSCEKSKVFPAKIINILKIGEETGSLDNILLKTSEIMEEDLDQIIENSIVLIEPILIIFMALIIGSIAIAVISPILEMSSIYL